MQWILFLVLMTSGALAQTDPRIEALTKRIEQLERQQEELLLSSDRNSNQVSSFLKDGLTLGGFFESGISSIEGPDTRFQLMNNSNIIGLNIAAEYNQNLRFVTQFIAGLTNPLRNPHNDPRFTPSERVFGDFFFGAVLTQGYLEFSQTNHLRIQAGMGYVPFGYYPQQRELVLFVRRGGPQLLRTNDLFAPLWSGIHLSGSLGQTTQTGYHLYTMNPMDDSNMLGVGGRVWAVSRNEEVAGGLSTQISKYDGHTSEVVGADIRLNTEPVIVTSEYALHMVADGSDVWSVYVEPAIRVKDDEFLIYTFADYAQSSQNETSAVLEDPFTKWEYGGGLNWLPTSYTRLRIGVTFHDYIGSRAEFQNQDKDYISFDFSVGVAF